MVSEDEGEADDDVEEDGVVEDFPEIDTRRDSEDDEYQASEDDEDEEDDRGEGSSSGVKCRRL